MDRHLLPDEIDQLLDGEVGFGTAPLKSHVRRCADCREELESARSVVRSLERLPYYAPSSLFAQRVMAQVQIFVPWHVALLDGVRGLMPRSRPARAAATLGLGTVAAMLTIASLWLITQLDTALFALQLGLGRARSTVGSAISESLAGVVGEPALIALRASGPWGLMVAAAVLLLITAAAASALRALASGSRQR
ncbi:MAG TPA: hypothetical protein VJ596_06190 [Gemmatimonadaceae bacterium]|nr:hypothetical protein [Gemmatimonadaceae bacterium]